MSHIVAKGSTVNDFGTLAGACDIVAFQRLRYAMTSPFSRTKALVQTKELLQQLADPGTPVVPENLRCRAHALLLAFPSLAEIDALHRAAPDLLGPAPPFSRLSGSGDVLGVIDATRPDD
jgi:hypothetical protein